MSEWKKYKLGELGFFFGGVTSIKKEDYGHGTPFLPYKNVYKNSKVNVNELELMNVRPLDLERRNAIYGDIFFTASSETPDEVAMSSVLLDEVENLTFNGFCKRFRLHDFNTLLPEYARYLFRDISFRREVYQLATGDIRFNISQESLANIEIVIPDLPTQRQIAQILSSLDDKIELNLQMNQTLEAMAQAIFKEWFVDFNFPTSESGFSGLNDEQDIAGKRKKSSKSKNSVNQGSDNGLPKGWRWGKLGEEFNLIMGQSPPGTSYNEIGEGMVFYQGRTDFGFRFPTNRLYTTEPKRIAKPLDTLVSVRAPVGDINMANEICCVGRGLSSVRHKSNAYSFTYYMMKNLEPVFNGFEGEGTVFGSINKSNFECIEIIVPSDEIVSEFETVVNPIDDKILENTKQIHTLTQLRDTLLPKLMSGQIRLY
jgi:type I restriction enzyme S subunit